MAAQRLKRQVAGHRPVTRRGLGRAAQRGPHGLQLGPRRSPEHVEIRRARRRGTIHHNLTYRAPMHPPPPPIIDRRRGHDASLIRTITLRGAEIDASSAFIVRLSHAHRGHRRLLSTTDARRGTAVRTPHRPPGARSAWHRHVWRARTTPCPPPWSSRRSPGSSSNRWRRRSRVGSNCWRRCGPTPPGACPSPPASGCTPCTPAMSRTGSPGCCGSNVRSRVSPRQRACPPICATPGTRRAPRPRPGLDLTALVYDFPYTTSFDRVPADADIDVAKSHRGVARELLRRAPRLDRPSQADRPDADLRGTAPAQHPRSVFGASPRRRSARPRLACHPATAPDLSAGGAPSPATALNELEAAAHQAAPAALVPLNDPMTLNGRPSPAKTNLHRRPACWSPPRHARGRCGCGPRPQPVVFPAAAGAPTLGAS
jgi:hypothetical protein